MTSRNSPCPCGSGRKYKRCCLAVEKRVVRTARFDDAVGRRIQDWTSKVASEQVDAALEEFAGPDRTMDDDDVQIFSAWFHNDRRLPSGGTPAERYAARDDLPPDEREAASRIAAARLGLYRWRVHEPVPARKRIRAFGGLAPGDPCEIEITVPRDRLLPEDRPSLPEGALVIQTEYIGDSDEIPIATVRLDGRELHVEAMSKERFDLAIEAVDTDFRDIAEPVERDVTPIEKRLEERRESSASVGDDAPAVQRPAEERHLLSKLMTDQMRRWLDEPLPILGGETPREAAAGKRRDDVVTLVRGIENHADRARRRGEAGAEVAWLRAELAIEDELAA